MLKTWSLRWISFSCLILLYHLLGNFLFINVINLEFVSVHHFTIIEDRSPIHSFIHTFNKHKFSPKFQALCWLQIASPILSIYWNHPFFKVQLKSQILPIWSRLKVSKRQYFPSMNFCIAGGQGETSRIFKILQ